MLDGAGDAEAGVRGLVEHHLHWIVHHQQRAQFLVAYRDHEIRPASDELRGLNRRFYEALEHWLTGRATRDPLPPLPVVVAQWIGPVHNYSRHWLTARHVTPAESRQFLSDGAWSSLRTLFVP